MYIIVSRLACHREYAEQSFTQTPLVLFLVASIIMAAWSSCLLFHYINITPEEDWGRLPQIVGLLWPCKHSTGSLRKPFQVLEHLQIRCLSFSLRVSQPSLITCCKHPTSLSPRPYSKWNLCVVCASRDTAGPRLLSNLLYQVLRYLTRTKKQVYAPKKRKVCLLCLGIPVVCAQLLLGTIANRSSREHRMAICTATDSLRHMRIRILYHILDQASGKCPRLLPLRGTLLACCSPHSADDPPPRS